MQLNRTEEFQESDVVDVLAVTWKEKRSEINRLQKGEEVPTGERTETTIQSGSRRDQKEIKMSQVR